MSGVSLAPIVSLFDRWPYNQRLFIRIERLLAARIVEGRLYVELFVHGARLPDPWLHTLRFAIVEPATREEVASANIEVAVNCDAAHLLVRTKVLEPSVPNPLPAGALLRLRCRTAPMREHPLGPLLSALL